MAEAPEAPAYMPVSTSEKDDPPSYFDVVGQMRAAKADSKSFVDLAIKIMTILLGSCN